MADLQRLRYVSEHYAHLQGLRLVPLGLPFLGSAAWRAGCLAWWPATDGHGAEVWFLASLAMAIVVSFPLRAHYRQRWGWIPPPPRRSGAVTLLSFVLAFTLLPWHQIDKMGPSGPVLLVGFALVVISAGAGGLRRHYLAIAGGCVLFATAPLYGASAHSRDVGLDLLIGIGLITAGWGDHLVLRRTFSGAARRR